jgi:flagellar hook assembly protein FlgD
MDLPPGNNEVAWNGENDAGNFVAAGLYFVKAQAGDQVRWQKILMLK